MRIGIVNDLPIAVEALRRAIAHERRHQILWIAADGAEAVVKCRDDPPDLVLMDLLMPTMDGVEATRRIMAERPCPILLVTACVDANTRHVFDALGHGAIDAIDTPVWGSDNGTDGVMPLLRKIAAIETLVGDGAKAKPVPAPPIDQAQVTRPPLVAIGSSAGGPAALATVLEDLPANFPGAVIIVQHIDERFAAGLAEWLQQFSKLPVRAAVAGDRIVAGTILLAATSDHLVLGEDGRLAYVPEPASRSYRPSIDVFFDSLVAHWRGDVVAILLTGMGRDGAEGLKALRDNGHHSIAQDQATSAVYGMPGAAAKIGAAIDILPLPQIAPRLIGIVGAKVGKGTHHDL